MSLGRTGLRAGHVVRAGGSSGFCRVEVTVAVQQLGKLTGEFGVGAWPGVDAGPAVRIRRLPPGFLDPVGDRRWGQDELPGDRFGRHGLKPPQRQRFDFAWDRPAPVPLVDPGEDLPETAQRPVESLAGRNISDPEPGGDLRVREAFMLADQQAAVFLVEHGEGPLERPPLLALIRGGMVDHRLGAPTEGDPAPPVPVPELEPLLDAMKEDTRRPAEEDSPALRGSCWPDDPTAARRFLEGEAGDGRCGPEGFVRKLPGLMPALLDAFEDLDRPGSERLVSVGPGGQVAAPLSLQLLEALLAAGTTLDMRGDGFEFVCAEELRQETLKIRQRGA